VHLAAYIGRNPPSLDGRSSEIVPSASSGGCYKLTMTDDTKADCVVIRGGEAFAGAQGLDYFEGVSRETTGARGICMHRLEMPPGAAALPHLHEDHETAIFMRSGTAQMRYGDGLERELELRAGDFLYIPAGMPHLPFNASEEHASAILARTDPKEQESVVLLDEHGRRLAP
jgi:uncharacterized RmlC-like cupin family protein